jgi:predicted Zn-dependent protease
MFGRELPPDVFPGRQRSSGGGGFRLGGGLLVALVMAGFALFNYWSSRQVNPITGESQSVALNTEQEIALGIQSAPEMAAQHGGLYQDAETQAWLDRIGNHLVRSSLPANNPYPFDFHVLADAKTVNAFALPGGQVFITWALLNQLETEGQVAGVLGHEIAHVVQRHSAQRIAKEKLIGGLTGAVAMGQIDPRNPTSGASKAAMAALFGKVIGMKYGREDETESDRLGVRIMASAGYDPRSMRKVMEVLKAAASGPRPPEFMSTHPSPETRLEDLDRFIAEIFPNGVPSDLRP